MLKFILTNIDEIKNVRRQKLQNFLNAKKNPYPNKPSSARTLAKVAKENFDELSTKKIKILLAGRITSIREHGNSAFVDLQDTSDKIQIFMSKKDLPEGEFKFFLKNFDTGDFAEFSGFLFKTQMGEKTLHATSFGILTKSLEPMPDKWHGIQDLDLRYRKRYLDIFMNPNLKEMFEKKAKFWDVIRNFMKSHGFFEVETPTLETTTGGAEANPFITHHNNFDLDVYLRISVGELWQKRLMSAGFEKTFEIGRVYRNEGSSPNHLQEFTNMEFYWAYANYRDGMELTKSLIIEIAKQVFGTTKFKSGEYEFDLSDEWKELDYVSTTEKMTGVNVLTATEDEMKKRLQELGIKFEGETKERMIDSLWKFCRKQISGPAFLINHPKIVSPLAKANPQNPELTERFQIILAGTEACNGYSELNDPVDQRARFEEQQKLIEKGDVEAMMPDWEFCEMLEYGMPPTCGLGIGERLFAMMVNKPIRETTLFPLMKPERKEEKVSDEKIIKAVENFKKENPESKVWKFISNLKPQDIPQFLKEWIVELQVETDFYKKYQGVIFHTNTIIDSRLEDIEVCKKLLKMIFK
ncbi:MAG: lysine--tRNA ligase [Patescibacteria group bacterium]